MPKTRYRELRNVTPLRNLPAAALRVVIREGYTLAHLRRDVLAGVVVGVIAVPLAMALAIGVGAPPQHGLYTAIVAGFVIAALGGSRTQVSGPTAAFIVVLAPIYAKFGMAGLLLSGLLGGVILIAMGLMRLGRFIEFIPHPVTTGFTAGIATVIAFLQIKDLFGLQVLRMPENFFPRVAAMFEAWETFSPPELIVGLSTLTLLALLPRLTRRVPAPLIALPLVACACVVIHRFAPGFAVETIASRFHGVASGQVIAGIPQLPPLPMLPWRLPGPEGVPFGLTFDAVRILFSGALAIAVLAAIESLLSAVVADGMVRTRHDPDAELLALGVGNVITPFFGGIPATGAIARTATNVRSGARSPIAAMVHALTVLVVVLIFARLMGYLPMATLAALLLLVAWNMADAKHVFHIVRVAPRSDVAVLLVCFVLTVAFDMVMGVAVGMVLAAFMFMKRMADVTETRIAQPGDPDVPATLPDGVVVYEISGPLFFGAAEKAMATLEVIADRARAVILMLNEVHAMDATGMVALESALERLRRRRCLAVLCGMRAQPLALLRRAEIDRREWVTVCSTMSEAITVAGVHAATVTPTKTSGSFRRITR